MLISVFGKRGSGKTTIIRGNLENFPGPIVVIDALGNFTPDRIQDERQREQAKHYFITSDIEDLISKVEEWVEDEDFEEKEKIENKVFVLQASNLNLGLDFACAALWELDPPGGTLVLDEVDSFSLSEAPCFEDAIRYGRNRDIHLVTGCRRPAEISKHITAGADRIFILRTQEPRDIEYWEKTLLGDEAEKLMSLPKWHGLYIDYFTEKKGLFKFDEDGTIFLLSSEPLNQ